MVCVSDAEHLRYKSVVELRVDRFSSTSKQWRTPAVS